MAQKGKKRKATNGEPLPSAKKQPVTLGPAAGAVAVPAAGTRAPAAETSEIPSPSPAAGTESNAKLERPLMLTENAMRKLHLWCEQELPAAIEKCPNLAVMCQKRPCWQSLLLVIGEAAAAKWAKAAAAHPCATLNACGHKRVMSGPIMWCTICGHHAQKKLRNLAAPCPGKPGGAGTKFRLLRKNRHPYTKVPLPPPIPEFHATFRLFPPGTPKIEWMSA